MYHSFSNGLRKIKNREMIFLKKNPHNDEKHLILVHSDPQFHKEENFQNYAKVIEDIAQLKKLPRQGHSGCRFRGSGGRQTGTLSSLY
jgi:shikimate kinase